MKEKEENLIQLEKEALALVGVTVVSKKN